MRILEIVLNEYYFYIDAILKCFAILFSCTIFIGVYSIKERRDVVKKLVQNFFYIIVISCIGELACILGLELEIEYAYFNAIVFLSAIGIILLYGIVQSAIFMKVRIPILQACKNIKYILFCELFLLVITKQLEVIGWTVGILAVEGIEIVIELLERWKSNEKDRIIKESDYPNPDLYYTRQKQLEKFIPVLEQQKSEPYAVMISSEWGMGKSSFMEALEKRCSRDDFIWIRAGSEKSVSEIMSEISDQILDVLRKNNIFIEREGLIEKYFLSFSELLGQTGLGIFKIITNIFEKDTAEDAQKYLNRKLKELEKINKTIYLVIDDLDRCDKEYQLKMFRVIRESTQLVQCKTLFLVDKNEFLVDKEKNASQGNYIEKYVSYTLDLCEVDYIEIVNYLIYDLFDNEFVQSMNSVFTKGRDAKEIRKMICQFRDEILEICEQELNAVKGDRNNKNVEMKREVEKELEETKLIIKKNTVNSRKVKKFLKGIKRDIEYLNDGVDKCGQEHQKEDWLRAVIEVQFLKNILPDIYNAVKMSNTLSDFEKEYTGRSIQILLGLRHRVGFSADRKREILNYIIYEVDVIDFEQVKVESEKTLEELHSNNATINHINDYVIYARSYDDLSKILDVCRGKQFNSDTERENFVKAILNCLSEYSSFSVEKDELLEFSRNLIEYLKQLPLSEKENDICKNAGEHITWKIIVDNRILLIKILYFLFEIREVEEQWRHLSSRDINGFYTMLKQIDSDSVYKGLEDETNRLLSIRTYYENLITELRKEKYKDLKLEIDAMARDIGMIFGICELWLDIEFNLNNDENNSDKVMKSVSYYFYPNMRTYRDIVFSNPSCLKNALEALDDFYKSKEGNYESDFSPILLDISYRAVLLYEENEQWFEGRELEISMLLEENANTVYQLHKSQGIYDKNEIDDIRMYVWKFSQYCKNIKTNNC